MSTINLEREGKLAILRMVKGRANAIDGALLDDLIEACETIRADDGISGVLFASSHPKVFCPGLDLQALQNAGKDELTQFMTRFAEAIWALFSIEKPLVAAIAGHAVAGGCVLALTADHRVLNEERAQMGLNEVRVGVPLPRTVTLLIQFALSSENLTRVALDGSNFQGEAAVAVGLAHELAPAENFEATCLERLSSLADREPRAFAVTKRFLREMTLEGMRAGEAESVALFVESWLSEGSQARIQAQIASLKGPKSS